MDKIKKILINTFSPIFKYMINVDYSSFFTNPKSLMVVAAILIILFMLIFNMGIIRLVQGILVFGVFFFMFLWKKE